ncbi:hypothetical protein D1007_34882 [Hordeum vulgare]|nr:hypothetical protein D1007_34882 [Hordeum vulgare]
MSLTLNLAPDRGSARVGLPACEDRAVVVRAGGEGKKKAADVVPAETDPSKCEMMVPCSEEKCTEHCVRIGLGNARGFCSFHDLHFECCCPMPPPRRLSSSGRRTGSV